MSNFPVALEADLAAELGGTAVVARVAVGGTAVGGTLASGGGTAVATMLTAVGGTVVAVAPGCVGDAVQDTASMAKNTHQGRIINPSSPCQNDVRSKSHVAARVLFLL